MSGAATVRIAGPPRGTERNSPLPVPCQGQPKPNTQNIHRALKDLIKEETDLLRRAPAHQHERIKEASRAPRHARRETVADDRMISCLRSASASTQEHFHQKMFLLMQLPLDEQMQYHPKAPPEVQKQLEKERKKRCCRSCRLLARLFRRRGA